ncbi:tetratricopeptide repeat protein [Variovorax boronicumulans]|uniref:tetratricopeptide repeat protein n=1 Tax=Variovorax boronicumulans TaxID=436515 RepID=UPI0033932054
MKKKPASLLPRVPALLAAFVLFNPVMEAFAVDNPTPQPLSSASSFMLSPEQRTALTAKAEAGDAEAAFRLANFHTFTAYDPAKRMHWLAIAAKGGHAVAQNNLAYDYLHGDNKDLKEAARWASESLKNGNAAAADLLKEIEAAQAKQVKQAPPGGPQRP